MSHVQSGTLTRGPSTLFLDTLDGSVADKPPIWLMRQAGRYLPEYREMRATAPSFLDFCYNPKLASEATLQPIRRFGFDAAILFSDILVIPDALGQTVSFETGHGPRLDPLIDAADVDQLHAEIDMNRLSPVLETVTRAKAMLGPATPLIGFCGAPWTVASYMIAGRGTPDQAPARLFAYRHPDLFQRLIDRLVDASVTYLTAQVSAGVDAIQIFDSWAGVLPTLEYERWCLRPVQTLVTRLRVACPTIRIIAFPRATGRQLIQAADGQVSALGLDTSVDVEWANRVMPHNLTLQGNLDPLALVAGGEGLDHAITRILKGFAGRPHVFNLGHGILPETPIAHVEHLVARVRAGL
ncbi:uroporphyrinogen decarboxylase [Lichenihabitans sp. PAMC28606]|uniref:uroporphyrinogen decarboxylase n=1 Tax=Lichenihabitans sp. PAMC28606 TaxID=2880932 RepID=UPI001D0A0648|nr:uroporphyrinogen decarboxylase [Lichenihabitans sp. PAMC28606]